MRRVTFCPAFCAGMCGVEALSHPVGRCSPHSPAILQTEIHPITLLNTSGLRRESQDINRCARGNISILAQIRIKDVLYWKCSCTHAQAFSMNTIQVIAMRMSSHSSRSAETGNQFMKPLPIGIQNIDEVIHGGYYVDKTALIERLISGGKYYFMSRPRRFGKSLLLSTLNRIFSGNKELFKGFAIDQGAYEWTQYPVISLDLSALRSSSTDVLKDDLRKRLLHTAKSYKIDIVSDDPHPLLIDLIETLALKTGKKVVVLVDEYDKPILDWIRHVDTADRHRDFLKFFFTALKSLDEHLKFVFVTGVTTCAQVSLFSGFNTLQDITIDSRYATLCGYTEEEIKKIFHKRISRIVEEAKKSGSTTTGEEILGEIKTWYNGYRFSEATSLVYNPHSILNVLDTGKFQNYWHATGSPTFLINEIHQRPYPVGSLSGSTLSQDELLSSRELRSLDIKALMWQTGYLTIVNYDSVLKIYTLDFPNQEVRSAFFGSLLADFNQIDPLLFSKEGLKCIEYLRKKDFTAFFTSMNIFIAKVPYPLHQKKEAFYHALVISLLEGMGIKTRSEEATNIGEIDLIIETGNAVIIFEFKIDKSSSSALSQIINKRYGEKYLDTKKEIVRIGVSFSSKSRSISEWQGEQGPIQIVR